MAVCVILYSCGGLVHSEVISYSCIHFVDVYFLFIDGKPPPPTETEMAAKLARLKGWKTFMVYIATET